MTPFHDHIFEPFISLLDEAIPIWTSEHIGQQDSARFFVVALRLQVTHSLQITLHLQVEFRLHIPIELAISDYPGISVLTKLKQDLPTFLDEEPWKKVCLGAS